MTRGLTDGLAAKRQDYVHTAQRIPHDGRQKFCIKQPYHLQASERTRSFDCQLPMQTTGLHTSWRKKIATRWSPKSLGVAVLNHIQSKGREDDENMSSRAGGKRTGKMYWYLRIPSVTFAQAGSIAMQRNGRHLKSMDVDSDLWPNSFVTASRYQLWSMGNLPTWAGHLQWWW